MDSRENSKYDEILMRLLCEEQSIPDFLNVVFGFLYRRTDLFVEQTGPDQKFGYPTGQCERLIYDSMKFFQLKAKERNQRGEEMHFDQLVENEIEIDSEDITSSVPQPNDAQDTPTKYAPTKDAPTKDAPTNSAFSSNLPLLGSKDSKPDEVNKSQHIQSFENRIPPVFIKREATTSSSSYNGADRDLYAWSQTICEIEVEVRVGASVLKSSQVTVRITSSTICVKVDSSELLNGVFPHIVKQDETVWTLTPGKYIQIHLEKSKDRWWDQLIQTEPKINLQQIDATRAFSELPQEEQMKVNEVIWNGYQKSQGMPTSEQIKTANILKKAWDAEGSPFKGRPFDPNIINNL